MLDDIEQRPNQARVTRGNNVAKVDSEAVEKTKQQIRRLVSDITELTGKGLSGTAFFTQFLTKVIQSLAAHAGAVWEVSSDGRLNLVCEQDIARFAPNDSSPEARQHTTLLAEMATSLQAQLVPPQSAYGKKAKNPTQHLLIFAPVKDRARVKYVIEIVQRADSAEDTRQGYLRFMIQMAGIAEDWLRRTQIADSGKTEMSQARVLELTRTIHSSLDLVTTCYAIANETRQILGVDRVSVAVRHGGQLVIQAVSGQAVVDSRSNVIRVMSRLINRVAVYGEPIWYEGEETDFPPEVEQALDAYLDESYGQAMCVIPLYRHAERDVLTADVQSLNDPPFAAIVIDQIQTSIQNRQIEQQFNRFKQSVSQALANAASYEDIPFRKTLLRLGKIRELRYARGSKRLWIAISAMLLLTLLMFLPVEHNIRVSGTLEPVRRRVVFSPVDGCISQIHFQSGTKVAAQTRLLDLLPTLDTAPANNVEDGEPFVQPINSPIEGHVLTWAQDGSLLGRQVNRGQPLLAVQDLDGPWEVVLLVQQRDYIDLLRSRQETDATGRVYFILVADPNNEHGGMIRDLSAGAPSAHSQVRLTADVSGNKLANVWPGAEVVARIPRGRRAVGYVYFHPLWERIRASLFY